jgi:hypothetical protein
MGGAVGGGDQGVQILFSDICFYGIFGLSSLRNGRKYDNIGDRQIENQSALNLCRFFCSRFSIYMTFWKKSILYNAFELPSSRNIQTLTETTGGGKQYLANARGGVSKCAGGSDNFVWPAPQGGEDELAAGSWQLADSKPRPRQITQTHAPPPRPLFVQGTLKQNTQNKATYVRTYLCGSLDTEKIFSKVLFCKTFPTCFFLFNVRTYLLLFSGLSPAHETGRGGPACGAQQLSQKKVLSQEMGR